VESLSFYDVENATTAVALDLGTIAPRSSEDFTLQVVNNSDLYQAAAVTVSITGDDAVQLWLSLDGEAFAPSVVVGDVAPGGSSEVFWLRRVTAGAEPVGTCTASLSALPALWEHPVDNTVSDNIPLDLED
jgi:hypothetical protein